MPNVNPHDELDGSVPLDYRHAVKYAKGQASQSVQPEANGASVTSYVKNGKVKYQTTSSGITSNGLIMDKTVYSWQEGQTTGFMMDMSKVDTGDGANTQIKDADDVRAEMEQYKPDCVKENTPDSIFSPPTSVKFEDMSKMLQDIRSKIPGQ